MRNNMIVRTSLLAAFCSALAIGFVAPAAHAEDYKVIANSGVGAASLTKDQVSQMFLKKLAKWPDGKAVVPVDQAKAAAVREAFSKAVLGRGAAAVVAFWQQQIFSGADVPPAEKANEADVIAFVKATPGAIGYVSAGADAGDCKVIAVN
jgi:ABC-type phosphate transport system substrate-binding protein